MASRGAALQHLMRWGAVPLDPCGAPKGVRQLIQGVLLLLCNTVYAAAVAPAPADSCRELSPCITQVAADPRLAGVIQELLAAQHACELTLRPPADLGLPLGSPLPWSSVFDAARHRGQTCIGCAS